MKNYRYRKTRIKRVMKGGVVCAPCIAAASGITSGKLLLGTALGLTGTTVLKYKKNSLKKNRRRNIKYITNIKQRTNRKKTNRKKRIEKKLIVK